MFVKGWTGRDGDMEQRREGRGRCSYVGAMRQMVVWQAAAQFLEWPGRTDGRRAGPAWRLECLTIGIFRCCWSVCQSASRGQQWRQVKPSTRSPLHIFRDLWFGQHSKCINMDACGFAFIVNSIWQVVAGLSSAHGFWPPSEHSIPFHHSLIPWR